MLHGVLWPLDTTFVMSAVEDVFARLLLLLEGILTLFRTSASFLAHLVPILLVRADGGM
jgi:hypothetical protein